MAASEGHSFPASHALQLSALVQRWGISPAELLSELGLDERTLEAPHARISLSTLRALTARARALTGEPGLGFYLGLQKRLSMYGYPGFAAMHASTVRESIELFVRYAPAISTGIGMELRVEDQWAILRITEHADLGDVHDVGVLSLLVGMRHLTSILIGRAPGRARFEITFAKPDYFDRFAHLLPDAVFDRPELRICFPARGLDFPLIMPDRAALNLAREACEAELLALGFERSLPARARKLLADAESLPSIESAARSLGLSTRTLKRKLAAEQATFSALLDAERKLRAERLLRTTDLSLEQVAQHLGYATSPSFARAFRRWTGETPAAHRRKT